MLVTRYRRKTLTPVLLAHLKAAFADCLVAWRCPLVEFSGESDHVHLLIDIHPAPNISTLINNLKTAGARRARNRFADHLPLVLAQRLLRWQRRRRDSRYRPDLCRFAGNGRACRQVRSQIETVA
ncbi:MAG: IS200/IS605 family transposase [Gammaproteobacteria bacterium]|nr:IS200/IS605 family transposase [Gammaproteobacteria bacterium]